MRTWVFFSLLAIAAAPCVSGPGVGERPKPYSFLVATGPERGQQTCYVCDTADKRGVIVFARTLSEPLGKLLTQIDPHISMDGKNPQGVRGWLTMLPDDQPDHDARLVAFGRKLGIRNMPLGVFEADKDGPPAYKLTAEADITVLVFEKRKVLSNFAFRSGELTAALIDTVVKSVPANP